MLPRGTFRWSLARAVQAGAGVSLLSSLLLGVMGPSRQGSGASAGGGGVTPVVPAYRKAEKGVAVITVRGEIDLITSQSLERRIREARDAGFDAMVIEIDTPGGRSDAALDIDRLLKTEAPPNTVAWINPTAYSAGAILALACREIVVHPASAWGDCAPIAIGLEGLIALPPAERAKAEAPLLAVVVDSARRNHYDERLVESFISVGIELWMIEHVSTGERVIVNRSEYETVFGEPPPDQFSATTPKVGGRAVTPLFGSPLNPIDPRDPSTVSPEQQRREIERAQTLPSTRTVLTSADRGQWRLVRQVISSDRLLVVRAEESIEYGLASEVIRNDEELKAYFGTTVLRRYDESWSEGLVRFLIHPVVRGVLIVLFVISIIIEMAAPGFGLFGALAGVALLLLIGAPYLVGMAQWWEIVLILLGLVLVAVEIFVLPGLGVAGIAGALCLLVGVVGTFVSGDLGSAQGQNEALTGLGATVVAVAAGLVGLWLLSKSFKDSPLFQRFILSATTEGRTSTHEIEGVPHALGEPLRPMESLQPGDLGVAETDLRPGGRARFEGRLVEVVTQTGYIDAGTPVRIVSAGPFSVEVERA